MNQQLTGWISGDLKPVRVGVYERQGLPNSFSYWNGKRWSFSNETVKEAYADRRVPSFAQVRPWRGLAQESKL